MAVQTTIVMIGSLASAPYTPVTWTVYGQPATTDALSGQAGTLDPSTIRASSIIVNPTLLPTLTMQGTLLAGGTTTWTVNGQPDNLGLQSSSLGLLDINTIKCISIST